jgi:hypothetical protein
MYLGRYVVGLNKISKKKKCTVLIKIHLSFNNPVSRFLFGRLVFHSLGFFRHFGSCLCRVCDASVQVGEICIVQTFQPTFRLGQRHQIERSHFFSTHERSKIRSKNLFLWPTMPLFSPFKTQTMHVKSFYTQQHCYVSPKNRDSNPGGAKLD